MTSRLREWIVVSVSDQVAAKHQMMVLFALVCHSKNLLSGSMDDQRTWMHSEDAAEYRLEHYSVDWAASSQQLEKWSVVKTIFHLRN